MDVSSDAMVLSGGTMSVVGSAQELWMLDLGLERKIKEEGGRKDIATASQRLTGELKGQIETAQTRQVTSMPCK